ncbi:MAG: DNA mismatch repair protein MutS, partial [Pseudomonadota bacterium]
MSPAPPARPPAPNPPSPAAPTALHAALARAADATRKDALPPPLAAALPSPVPAPPAPTRAARRASAAARLAATRPARVPRPPASAPASSPPGSKRRAGPAPRRAGQRITDLQELATVARQLREQHEREQAEEKAQREAAARADAERQLFSHSVGPITPLRVRNLARLQRRLPQPLPLQHWLDEERVLLESISDDFDVSTLLDTD